MTCIGQQEIKRYKAMGLQIGIGLGIGLQRFQLGANVPLLNAIAFNYNGVETYVTLNFQTVETYIETNI